MTPRERDPLVWAATYADARGRLHESLYSASEGTPEERHRITLATMYTGRDTIEPRIVEIADAAVMALHPDGTYTAPDGTVLREPVDEGPRSYPGV